MASNERDLVERLLRQSILTLCRETISYQHSLEVDGIVCITPENENQQIVIKVHEQIQKGWGGWTGLSLALASMRPPVDVGSLVAR